MNTTDFTISKELYCLLINHRILAEVFRKAEIKLATGTAELNPKNAYAKLGVDSLLPLCRAIREVGYGEQLEVILDEYIRLLRNETT